MKKYAVISSILAVTLGGCGGGGGGDGANSSIVASVSPANGATGVSRSAAVTATFNTDIFAKTVSEASFSLAAKEPVDGTVSFDALANRTTFTPTQELSMLTSYTATLSTDITDLAGDGLSEVYSWSFTTADGALTTTSEQVQSYSLTGSRQHLRMSYFGEGKAIATWLASDLDSGKRLVWASHYTAGSGWEAPLLLQTDNTANGAEQQLVTDDSGNAFAVWTQDYGSIWVRRFDSTSKTWSVPEQISPTADVVGRASIALLDSGRAVAVWPQKAGLISDAYANFYTPGVGWGTAEPIDNLDGDTYSPKVDFDGSGNAIAVWSQYDGTQFSVYGNRFVAGEGWGSAGLLETIDTAPERRVPDPKLTVDEAGNAIVVWTQGDGTSDNLWTNRYDVSTGWQGETLLENLDADARYPSVSMNSSGTAIVMWSIFDDAAGAGRFTSRHYVPGEGWGSEEIFDFGIYTSVSDVVIDDRGHALLFWEYDDLESSTIWFNRYRADSGWDSPQDLSRSSDGYGEYGPRVSVKENGEAMVIFFGDNADGSLQIWSRLFN